MKRKVKRYDEGGVLTDRYGNTVKSGSGEDVKTRYGSSTPKENRSTSSGVEDYASMGKRAGVTSPFLRENISEETKKETVSEPDSVAGKGARNLAMDEKEEVKPVAVKKKVIQKTASQNFPLKSESRGSQSFPIGEGSKTLPGKLSDKEEKPQTLPGKPNAKEYYRDFSGKIKEKTPDTSSFKDFGDMISRGAGALGRNLSNYASTIKSPAQRRDEEKASKEKGFAKGGKVSTASSRGDGIAQRGKTRGRMC